MRRALTPPPPPIAKPDDQTAATEVVKETPLDYALRIMNDAGIDDARRDRMAIAAMPFMHGKPGEVGKREADRDAARQGATGKFAPPTAPRLVVSNH